MVGFLKPCKVQGGYVRSSLYFKLPIFDQPISSGLSLALSLSPGRGGSDGLMASKHITRTSEDVQRNHKIRLCAWKTYLKRSKSLRVGNPTWKSE